MIISEQTDSILMASFGERQARANLSKPSDFLKKNPSNNESKLPPPSAFDSKKDASFGQDIGTSECSKLDFTVTKQDAKPYEGSKRSGFFKSPSDFLNTFPSTPLQLGSTTKSPDIPPVGTIRKNDMRSQHTMSQMSERSQRLDTPLRTDKEHKVVSKPKKKSADTDLSQQYHKGQNQGTDDFVSYKNRLTDLQIVNTHTLNNNLNTVEDLNYKATKPTTISKKIPSPGHCKDCGYQDLYNDLKLQYESTYGIITSLQKQLIDQAESLQTSNSTFLTKEKYWNQEQESLRQREKYLSEKVQSLKEEIKERQRTQELSESRYFDGIKKAREDNIIIEQKYNEEISRLNSKVSELQKRLSFEQQTVKDFQDESQRQSSSFKQNERDYNLKVEELLKRFDTEKSELVKTFEKESVSMQSKQGQMESEILDLKKELSTALKELEYKEASLSVVEQDIAERVSVAASYKLKIDSLEASMAEELKTHNEEIAKMESLHIQNKEDLAKQWEEKVVSLQEDNKVLEENLKEKEVTLASCEDNLRQLRAYIGGDEQNSSSLRKELESQKDQCSQLQLTCETLQSTNELLNIRINSINEVLKIQEKEISSCAKWKSGNENGERLMQKWREKVYSLLVCLKSQEILIREDKEAYINQTEQLKEENRYMENNSLLLKHQLSEKSAAYQAATNENLNLKQKFVTLERNLYKMKNELKCSEKALKTVLVSLKGPSEKVLGDVTVFKKMLAYTQTLDQRICFATQRIHLLTDLLQRKEWKSQENSGRSTHDKEDVGY